MRAGLDGVLFWDGELRKEGELTEAVAVCKTAGDDKAGELRERDA